MSKTKFNNCYNHLCENIIKLMKLSPSSFTEQTTHEIYTLLIEIPRSTFMYEEFRVKLSKLFLLVLKILNKGSPRYLRFINYYVLKYLYRVEELAQSEFYFKLEVVTELTCDLSEELSRRVSQLTRETVIAEPVVLGTYNGLTTANNIGLPHATNYSEGGNSTHMYNTLVRANASFINSRNKRENGRIQYIIPNANRLGDPENTSLNGNNSENTSLNRKRKSKKGVITKRRMQNKMRNRSSLRRGSMI
jgi:hypothetical protein